MVFWQVVIFILSFIVSGLLLGVVLRHFFEDKLLRGKADGVFLPDKLVSMGFHPRGKPTGYSTPENKMLSFSESIILGLGFSPIAISIILYLLFLIFPSKTNIFYLFSIGLMFILTSFLLKEPVKLYFQQMYKSIQNFLSRGWHGLKSIALDKIIIILIVILVGFYIFYQAVGTGISSNDGCTYGQIGRYLYGQKNLNNYPFSYADSKTGFFLTGAQHPPALPLIYTWNFMMQGNSQNDVLARVVSPLYALYLAILIFMVLKKRQSSYAGIFGLFFLVFTPIMVWQSYANSIDPLRFFTLFAVLVILGKLVEFKETKLIILLGLCAGLMLYTHAISILALGVVLVVYFMLAGVPLKYRLLGVVAIASLALLVGGIPYMVSYVRFGNIIGPNTYSLIDLNVNNFYATSDFAKIGSVGQIVFGPNHIFKISKELIFARLQIFSRPEMFGLTYYFLVFGIIYWLRKIKKTSMDQVMFWSMFLISIPIIYKYYLNRRYILTTLPMAIYFSALGVGSYYEILKKNRKEKWVWIIAVGLFAVVMGIYFSSVSISSAKINTKNTGEPSNKFQYLLSNKKDQDRLISADIFAAVDFINQKTPQDAVILTYSYGRYYYYSQRKTLFWQDPVLKPLFNNDDKNIIPNLKKIGIGYFLIDEDYYTNYWEKLVQNPDLIELVFNHGVKVYRIR